METASTWTDADTERAKEIWAEYQRTHDVSDRINQTAGIDPASGSVWFGDSALDIVRQRDSEGETGPIYVVRVGYDYYIRKGTRR